MGQNHALRERHRPEGAVLYGVVAAELATFLQRLAAGERPLPAFVERELTDYLKCGILAHGFARVHCAACQKDELVAFSCKRRGFCPSCGGRRMAATATHLVDAVIPDVPVRQWVLSLPHRVRLLCVYEPDSCRVVRQVLLRAIRSYYLRAARAAALPQPQIGAVAFVQRFDSGLRLNVHLHVLFADGVFGSRLGSDRAEFEDHAEVTDADVSRLVAAIRTRVLRTLRRSGKLPAAGESPVPWMDGDPGAEEQLAAAAIQGRTAFGDRAGAWDARVGRGSCEQPFVKGPLCADVDGFSLNAAVRVPRGRREQLEKLCRYVARPPIAEGRLSRLPDGRVAYELKRRWRDGSTHVVLDPQVLLERLCALVPRPRRHLVTYHGVFAPAASQRDLVVPGSPKSAGFGRRGARGQCENGATGGVGDSASGGLESWPDLQPAPLRVVAHAPGKRRRGGRYYKWAELLRRVFWVEVMVCPHCGANRRLLAAIHDPSAMRGILVNMGCSPEPPARSPPRGEGVDGGGVWSR